ncbi:Proton-dependent oligopeptide transporter family [Cucumis melo var. makuwa]|uniref:Proton-dependent oligopeptide transporter family n=1 Tax=Cucumis melo var. makuwa TaxID=1194695 RepID=A0A5A7TXE1_CUCMM|nr:Proton-dependent oligopeptide transporter family [Cucumis melo var. makuwa]
MERVENDEAVISRAPRDERVGEGIIDHLISFENKRSYNVFVRGVGFHPIKAVVLLFFEREEKK